MKTKSIAELEDIVSLPGNAEKRVLALLELSSRYALSDILRAWLLSREAERDAEAINDKVSVAKANIEAGNALWKLADYMNSQKHFIKAVEYYEILGDHDGLSNAYCGLGIVHGSLKDYTQSLYYFEHGVEESDKAGNRKRSATNRGNIGSVHLQLENYDEALKNFSQSLEVYEELNDNPGIANMLNGIAGVKVFQGKFDEAYEYLLRHNTIANELQHHYGIATGLMNLGILYSKKGDYRLALEYLEKALLHAEREKVRSMKSGIHKCFAEVYTDMGKSDQALEHYKIYFELEKELKKKEIKQKAEFFERRKNLENGGEQKVA